MKTLVLRSAKRYMILLEVLIAMALVALCALPLIAPHFEMLKAQKKFISTLKLDHFTHLFYVDVLEQLQANKITWQQIQDKMPIPIDEKMWERINEKNSLNIKGNFQFEEIKSKFSNDKSWGAYLYTLTFTFEPMEATASSKKWVFPYTVYLLRKGAQTLEEEKPAETKKANESGAKDES